MDAEDSLVGISYYHATLDRGKAETLLKEKEDGTFLLRKSVRNDNYVISVILKNAFFHYSVSRIVRDGRSMYSVNNGTPFPTPREVCEHYMAMRGGLRVQLLFPVHRQLPADESAGDSTYVTEIPWYHNDISREEDSVRLSQGFRKSRSNGIFLVRRKEENKFVLSVVNAGRVHRYIINRSSSGVCVISGKPREYDSLESLINYHVSNPASVTGIQCQLTIPCPKADGPSTAIPAPSPQSQQTGAMVKQLADRFQMILPSDVDWGNSSFKNSDKTKTMPKQSWTPASSSSRSILEHFKPVSEPEECPGWNSPYQNFTGGKNVARDLFIPEQNITLYEKLGKGNFGAVHLARCVVDERPVPCAVKFLTGQDIVANKKELLSEAAIMQALDHPNIVRLIAVCDTAQNLMMLLELAPIGPLRDFLKRQDETTFSESKILNIMQQVCEGMAYLARNNVVHRDLAARNVLLVSENFGKVSDFGMSRVLRDSENYYRAVQPGSWPLRWYSPEALCYYKFTTKCDVWSYGVTLWEAFSYGSRPYKGMKGREILAMLENNERLDCPIRCPVEVYQLMQYCWTFDEEARPTFDQLLPILDSIRENQPSSPPPLQPRSWKGR